MQVTKKQFTKEMTDGESYFAGVVHRYVHDDEILLAMDGHYDGIDRGDLVGKRTAQAVTNGLKFGNGSYLFINGANVTVEKLEHDRGYAYIVRKSGIDRMDDEMTLVYFIDKENN